MVAQRRTPRKTGRKVGAAGTRLRDAFIAALAADYETNGKAALEKFREERPHEYVKLLGAFSKELGAAEEGEADGPVSIEVHFIKAQG